MWENGSYQGHIWHLGCPVYRYLESPYLLQKEWESGFKARDLSHPKPASTVQQGWYRPTYYNSISFGFFVKEDLENIDRLQLLKKKKWSKVVVCVSARFKSAFIYLKCII